jgi:hypothetical protein
MERSQIAEGWPQRSVRYWRCRLDLTVAVATGQHNSARAMIAKMASAIFPIHKGKSLRLDADRDLHGARTSPVRARPSVAFERQELHCASSLLW